MNNLLIIIIVSILFGCQSLFIYGCTTSSSGSFSYNVANTLWDSTESIGLKYSDVTINQFDGVTYELTTTTVKAEAIIGIMLTSDHLVDSTDRAKSMYKSSKFHRKNDGLLED